MLKIRLTRCGRSKIYFYRLVLAEKQRAVKGKFIEILGVYNPTSNPKKIEFDLDRVKYWLSKGAEPSATAASLLKNQNFEGMDKFMTKPTKKKVKKSEPKAS